ncbi:MAG: LamG-like jellyroll fold domain-containing protein, partial [Prochlorotrichaceae cyanobacterium]
AINTDSAGYPEKTIELWFRPDRLTGKQMLYEQGAGTNGLNLYLDDDVLRMGAWVNSAGEWLTTPVEVDQIYHAVLRFDQGKLTGFLNGEFLGELTPGFTTIASHTGDVAIGYAKDNSRFADAGFSGDGAYFQGTLEGLKLYNEAISTEQITHNYQEGTYQYAYPDRGNYFDGVIDNLKLYNGVLKPEQIQANYEQAGLKAIAQWSLDGNATNEGTLGSAVNGIYSGSPQNTESLILGEGSALAFNGDDGIDIPDNANLNTEGPYPQRTISLWFRADDLANRNMLYEEGGQASGLNIYLRNDTLNLGVWQGNEGEWLSTTINQVQTYQVVLSFNQGQLTGYLNGKAFATTTTAFTDIPTHSGDIGIGYTRDTSRLSNTT